MEDDYMMVIIPCIAEIAVSDTAERVKKLRLGAVSELQRYLHYYRQLGYMPKLLYAIADKKCRMIPALPQLRFPPCWRVRSIRSIPKYAGQVITTFLTSWPCASA